LKLFIIAFGKLKAPGLREATHYYLRNLSAWSEVEEIEIKPLTVPDKSPATRASIQEKEEKLLLEKLEKNLSSRGVFILLDEKGKSRPTQEWATLLRDLQDRSIPEIGFCIGSSLGFSESLRKKAHTILSLGPQTTSHEIARLVLSEQLYRAMSVLKGHPYHNEG